jgi:hypothetical protein
MKRTRGQPIDRATWERLLAAFRANPGQAALVARDVGVDIRTATKAWHDGWDTAAFKVQPIATIVQEEQIKARAALVAKEPRVTSGERDAARDDAVETRRREAVLVRGARDACIFMINAGRRLAMSMDKLAERTAAQLLKSEVEPREALRMMATASLYIQRTATAADVVMEMERKLLGGEKTGDAQDDSLEVAREKILKAKAALDRAERNNGLVVPNPDQVH